MACRENNTGLSILTSHLYTRLSFKVHRLIFLGQCGQIILCTPVMHSCPMIEVSIELTWYNALLNELTPAWQLPKTVIPYSYHNSLNHVVLNHCSLNQNVLSLTFLRGNLAKTHKSWNIVPKYDSCNYIAVLIYHLGYCYDRRYASCKGKKTNY